MEEGQDIELSELNLPEFIPLPASDSEGTEEEEDSEPSNKRSPQHSMHSDATIQQAERIQVDVFTKTNFTDVLQEPSKSSGGTCTPQQLISEEPEIQVNNYHIWGFVPWVGTAIGDPEKQAEQDTTSTDHASTSQASSQGIPHNPFVWNSKSRKEKRQPQEHTKKDQTTCLTKRTYRTTDLSKQFLEAIGIDTIPEAASYRGLIIPVFYRYEVTKDCYTFLCQKKAHYNRPLCSLPVSELSILESQNPGQMFTRQQLVNDIRLVLDKFISNYNEQAAALTDWTNAIWCYYWTQLDQHTHIIRIHPLLKAVGTGMRLNKPGMYAWKVLPLALADTIRATPIPSILNHQDLTYTWELLLGPQAPEYIPQSPTKPEAKRACAFQWNAPTEEEASLSDPIDPALPPSQLDVEDS